MKRTIFFDLETTGVRIDQDLIVEIAAYDIHSDARFERFVNPKVPIPKEAAAIHGISDAMVQDADTFDVVGKDFVEFLGTDAVLVAHNLDGFDKPLLFAECKRHGLELPKDLLYLDSLKWARKYRFDLPRHSLQFLREAYGIPENTAHRALDDVITLHKVFCEMTQDLDIETCMELLGSNDSQAPATGPIQQMPFGKHQGKALEEVPKSYLKWLLNEGAFDKEENQALKQALKEKNLIPS